MGHLIQPYGGSLINLLVDESRASQLKEDSQHLPSISLTQRQLCDLELLLNGGFSPLNGFMTKEVYTSVVDEMRLPDGKLWPIPIVLDIPDTLSKKLEPKAGLMLRDGEGSLLAALHVESIWRADKEKEANRVYGTISLAHPGVRHLFENTHDVYVGGRLYGLELPFHADFQTIRDTPEKLRNVFSRQGWRRIVGFHINEPMHRLHLEITLNTAREANSSILLHPVVGLSKPGDLHYYARVKCYQAVLKHYPHNLAMLSLLPLAMRMAGPREVLLNAIIRQNYGCSHYMIGKKQAEPPNLNEDGKSFYAPGSGQNLAEKYQDELDIRICKVSELGYVPEEKRFFHMSDIVRGNIKSVTFEQSDFKHHLARGLKIPEWYSFPEIIKILKNVTPPRSEQGITLFFTGLSGAGKSTLAKILYARFIEDGKRPVTLLDGDIVRQHLSSELGFSKEHRDLNVKRIGFVASEITKNRGIAICAPIAPYASTRRAVRELIEQHGAFIEIYVATPLVVCEARDRKGLYAKARKGLIPEFTGISDPYEIPVSPELHLDTSNLTPMEIAQEIFLYLLREGYTRDVNANLS